MNDSHNSSLSTPFIIDAHAHLGPTKGFCAPFTDFDEIIRLMDATYTEILIFSAMDVLSQQFGLGYDFTLEALKAYPDRFKAYTVYDPNWPDETLKLMEQFQDIPGFAGIKIHPAAHAVAAEDERYRPMWEFANKKQLIVLTHSWAPDPSNPNQDLSTPDRFVSYLEQYPDVKLILGHTGGRMVGHRRAVEVMHAFPNCWADISGDTLTLGLLEWLVGQVGSTRLLYGTDANWIEPRYHLGRVLKTGLSWEDKLNVLRSNALTLFGSSLLQSNSSNQLSCNARLRK